MVPVDRLSSSSLQSQAEATPSRPWQGLVSKWKRCAECERPLPIPTYFGGSDKEREEIHTLPLGVQQRGDLLFQSLTGTFFPLPLAATCVFVTTLFCSSSTKRSGRVLNRNRSFLRMDHTGALTFALKVCFGVVLEGSLLNRDSLWMKRLSPPEG